jgi:hypothetical protein
MTVIDRSRLSTQSGRPDLNRGPPVPQAVSAKWRPMVRSGGKWLVSRDFKLTMVMLNALCGLRFLGVWALSGHRWGVDKVVHLYVHFCRWYCVLVTWNVTLGLELPWRWSAWPASLRKFAP